MPNSPPISAAAARPAARSSETVLERIADSSGQGSTVFLHVDAEHARTAAHDALRRAGTVLSPLAGIPVSVKDLFDIEGQVTRACSRLLSGVPHATRATRSPWCVCGARAP